MAMKDWKRDWNIGGEYPEWRNSRDDLVTVYEGDTPDKFSVAVERNSNLHMKYLAENVSESKALKTAKDYMRTHKGGV